MKGSEIIKIIEENVGGLISCVKGVYSIDTIPKLSYKEFAVVNTGPSTTSGFHWFW